MRKDASCRWDGFSELSSRVSILWWYLHLKVLRTHPNCFPPFASSMIWFEKFTSFSINTLRFLANSWLQSHLLFQVQPGNPNVNGISIQVDQIYSSWKPSHYSQPICTLFSVVLVPLQRLPQIQYSKQPISSEKKEAWRQSDDRYGKCGSWLMQTVLAVFILIMTPEGKSHPQAEGFRRQSPLPPNMNYFLICQSQNNKDIRKLWTPVDTRWQSGTPFSFMVWKRIIDLNLYISKS